MTDSSVVVEDMVDFEKYNCVARCSRSFLGTMAHNCHMTDYHFEVVARHSEDIVNIDS